MGFRLLDLPISLVGVFVLSPLFVLTAVLVKITSPGPVFFIQKRIGKGGREFPLIKFRSMRVKRSGPNDHFDVGDRSRITSFGKALRRTKLDELPQLINVIKGDMSIVGPRPEVKKWTEIYPEKWKIVHSVRPGITDYASIYFRNEEEILANSQNPEATYRDEILPRKLDLNIAYIQNQSIFEDLKIIFKTIYTVLLK